MLLFYVHCMLHKYNDILLSRDNMKDIFDNVQFGDLKLNSRILEQVLGKLKRPKDDF